MPSIAKLAPESDAYSGLLDVLDLDKDVFVAAFKEEKIDEAVVDDFEPVNGREEVFLTRDLGRLDLEEIRHEDVFFRQFSCLSTCGPTFEMTCCSSLGEIR